MLDDALLTAISETNKILKEKFSKKSDRIFFLLFMIAILVIPIFVFDHWVGRIAGLILASLIYASIVFYDRKENKNKSLKE